MRWSSSGRGARAYGGSATGVAGACRPVARRRVPRCPTPSPRPRAAGRRGRPLADLAEGTEHVRRKLARGEQTLGPVQRARHAKSALTVGDGSAIRTSRSPRWGGSVWPRCGWAGRTASALRAPTRTARAPRPLRGSRAVLPGADSDGWTVRARARWSAARVPSRLMRPTSAKTVCEPEPNVALRTLASFIRSAMPHVSVPEFSAALWRARLPRHDADWWRFGALGVSQSSRHSNGSAVGRKIPYGRREPATATTAAGSPIRGRRRRPRGLAHRQLRFAGAYRMRTVREVVAPYWPGRWPGVTCTE